MVANVGTNWRRGTVKGASQGNKFIPSTWIYDSARSSNLYTDLAIPGNYPEQDVLNDLKTSDPQWARFDLNKYDRLLKNYKNSSTSISPTLWRPSRQAITNASFPVQPPGTFAADPLLVASLPGTDIVQPTVPGAKGIYFKDQAFAKVRDAYTAYDWAGQEQSPLTWVYLDQAKTSLNTYPGFRQAQSISGT